MIFLSKEFLERLKTFSDQRVLWTIGDTRPIMIFLSEEFLERLKKPIVIFLFEEFLERLKTPDL